LSKRSQIASFV